jgi:putative ABC transport system permease protein
MSWYRRFTNLMRSDKVTRDLDREFAHHLAERRDDLMKAGMNADSANAEARRRFGNATAQKERTREVDVLTWLESCFADIRHAFRALRRSPGFAAVAVLSLALGIGANTAIFTLIDAVMLKSLPVSHPEQLAAVTLGPKDYEFTNPLWEEIRNRQDMFAGVFATGRTQFDLTTGGEVRRARGEYVSGDYFNVLGVRPSAGRLFVRDDDVRGCRAIAVLSDAFWMSEFGGDSRAIGRPIELNGKQFEIVGVTDPSFFGVSVGMRTQVYTPICAQAVITGSDAALDERDQWWLTITARRRPEIADAQLQQRLIALSAPVFESTVATRWSAKNQEAYIKQRLNVEPRAAGLSELRDKYRTALYTLMVVVGVVLLIACGNVANLLLARARARQREAAVRLAIGAGRGRLVRQLLTESLVLSALGTAAGILVAFWGTRVLVSLLVTGRNAVWLDLGADARVLAFTSATAVFTGLLFGIAPAWRSARVDPQGAMRGAGRGIAGEHNGLSLVKALVVAQVALSLVLLVGAGLLLESFVKQLSIDPGFRSEGVLVVSADARRLGLESPARSDLYRNLLARLSVLPGVRMASTADIIPLGNTGWNSMIHVDGFVPKDGRDGVLWCNAVRPAYFETMGTPMIAGRDFGPGDTPSSPKVAIVNEAVAKKFFHGENPVGKSFALDKQGNPGDVYQVVGMVKDAKYKSVRETSSETIFLAAGQDTLTDTRTNFVLRTNGRPSVVVPAVRSAIKDMNPLIAFDFSTLDGIAGDALARPQLLARLSIFFGALALMLAVVGLYGTMSYSVERRRNEIGIRVALGAARGEVLTMVIGEAGRMVVAGIALGVVLAIAATRWVSSLLYGVTPTDTRTYLLAAVILATVALAAGAVPAWRASRLDPMEALREE